MDIAIDFDGTLVSHQYPYIGKDIGAVPVVKKLIDNGHNIILNTMRFDKTLDEAVDWCKSKGIVLYGVNINPTQRRWTKSPKVEADIYIDDAALGIPLFYDEEESRPYVDWSLVEILLKNKGLI